VDDAADRGNGEPVTFIRPNGAWSFDSKEQSYQYICERSMYGRRECYEEWHDNGQCQREKGSNYYSVYKYDLSECISGNDIYGDDGTEPWYYTPTSRCHDSECTDCEDFTSMPSGKNTCTPCSFEENCSFMEVECRRDDPILNCPLYKTHAQLPKDWCNQIDEWAICGVADGTVSGSGYGCKFQRGKHGYCKALNSGDQCNKFQDPCGCGTGKFCNFDDGHTGGCEDCSNHANRDSCYSDGLPSKGAEDCSTKCFDALPIVGSNSSPPMGYVAKSGSGPCLCSGNGIGLNSCGELCCASSPFTSTDPDDQYFYQNGGAADISNLCWQRDA